MRKVSYFHVFNYLLLTDFKVMSTTLLDQMINLVIWVSTQLLITSYILPYFGLSHGYSSFILAGLCTSAGLFGVFPSVVNLVDDFEGVQIINYYLTLPLPAWLVLLRAIIFYAINFAIIGLLVLPIGKLLIWSQFDLAQVSLLKFLLLFIVLNFFYGAFVLWIASRVKNLTKIGNVWMRFVYPIWFLGGFQFSWFVLFDKVPQLAYLNLFNPITYGMEGMRAAILGQENFLNYWVCLVMLTLFSILCAWHGIARLKKRLDFV